MAETQEGFNGYLGKLALIADVLDDLYNGKKTVIFELSREEFVKMRNELNGVQEDRDKFKIDISGIEFIYLLDE
jgi:hypothetical protein